MADPTEEQKQSNWRYNLILAKIVATSANQPP